MILRKGYKYCLRTRNDEVIPLARNAGCCRLVWNKALSLQKERLDKSLKILTYPQLCAELTLWKKDPQFSFLKEVHSQILQQTLKDLDRAIKEAFAKKKGFPHFKKKFRDNSFRYPQGVKLDQKRIFLPKIGWISFFHSIAPQGVIKNVTVSKRNDKWFVSLQTEYEVSEPKHSSSSIVGLDMGVVRFATLSTGEYYPPLNSFIKLENKLALEQKKLTHKEKFSKNWKKQKERISKLHGLIANARRDYLHKLSTQLSKNHAMIVLEDLKISQMSQSVKGTSDQPGKGVQRKSQLNKSILDQGWYEFRRQLEYKQIWRGGKVIAVSPRHTSQKCPECAHVSPGNRKNQATFCCLNCCYTDNADKVAARNVLAVGQTVAACESNFLKSRKQELAELREEMLC
jgi:putative transposase